MCLIDAEDGLPAHMRRWPVRRSTLIDGETQNSKWDKTAESDEDSNNMLQISYWRAIQSFAVLEDRQVH